ncbi:phosphatase domain-containing protein [Chitinivorax sp. B]|uniref:phosphatase domain-containing protein n=1 Tax=Chitinivorax sp. B TaxID=2502235 RepID=UPI0010F7B281|nr:phosphatase domain-containing protein [Chitinivorax sp. B]
MQNIIDDGWATLGGYRFSGRLTADTHRPAAAGSGRLRSTYRTLRMLLASSADGPVNWSVGGLHWATRADEHGYWSLSANQPLPLSPGWYPISSTIPHSSQAHVLVPDPHNQVGIISDIDDTILISDIFSKRKLVKHALTLPPEARLVVSGMPAFYRQLLAVNPNPALSPVFYVSATPRQLTDSLRRFLARHQFPQGVLMLKEVSRHSADPLFKQQAYKLERITQILHAFPEVKFVLIGDDGERDPATYAELQQQFPDRIESVWIRHVMPGPASELSAGQRYVAPLSV